MTRPWFLALLLSIATAIGAQARLASVIGSESELLQLFPEQETITYRTDQFHQPTNQRRQFEGTVRTSRQLNTLQQSSSNPYSSTVVTANGSVRFGRIENRLRDEEAIRRLGYDAMVTSRTGNQVRTQKLENGREVKLHTWTIDPNTVDGDMIPVLLRVLTAQRRLGSFLAQVLTKWDGGSYEMQFQSETVGNLLARERQLAFPPPMRQLLTQRPDAVVWSMGLTGPASLFFPHRFYFVYEQEQPHRLLGSWGGPPDRASYTWLTQ